MKAKAFAGFYFLGKLIKYLNIETELRQIASELNGPVKNECGERENYNEKLEEIHRQHRVGSLADNWDGWLLRESFHDFRTERDYREKRCDSERSLYETGGLQRNGYQLDDKGF